MTYRRAAVLAMFAAVLAVDTVTKLAASKTDVTWHHDPLGEPGRPSTLTTLVVIASAILVTWVCQSVGFAVALAGVLGNLGWAVATGGTPNPIVDITHTYPNGFVDLTAFNVADIAIQGGGVCGALEVAIWVVLAGRGGRAILAAPLNDNGPGV